MAGFVPVAKNFGEALGYSALDITSGKIAGSIAAGIAGAAIMHNDERPVASTVGGYALGEGLAIAGMIAGGAMKYMK